MLSSRPRTRNRPNRKVSLRPGRSRLPRHVNPPARTNPVKTTNVKPSTSTVHQAVTRTQSNSYVVNPSTPTARYTGAATPGAIDQLYRMTSPVGNTGQFDSYRNIGGSPINTPVQAGPVHVNGNNTKR